MAVERTLSIIKPDATRRNLTGKINARFEDNGLRIVAQRRLQLTRVQARSFLRCSQRALVLQRPVRLHDLWSSCRASVRG